MPLCNNFYKALSNMAVGSAVLLPNAAMVRFSAYTLWGRLFALSVV